MTETQGTEPPKRQREPTTQMKLALPKSLHARLRAAADADRRSLHSKVVLILSDWADEHQPKP